MIIDLEKIAAHVRKLSEVKESLQGKAPDGLIGLYRGKIEAFESITKGDYEVKGD